MKNDLQSNPALFKIVILFTCFMLVLLYNRTKAAAYLPDAKELSVSFKQSGNETGISRNALTGKPAELCLNSIQKK